MTKIPKNRLARNPKWMLNQSFKGYAPDSRYWLFSSRCQSQHLGMSWTKLPNQHHQCGWNKSQLQHSTGNGEHCLQSCYHYLEKWLYPRRKMNWQSQVVSLPLMLNFGNQSSLGFFSLGAPKSPTICGITSLDMSDPQSQYRVLLLGAQESYGLILDSSISSWPAADGHPVSDTKRREGRIIDPQDVLEHHKVRIIISSAVVIQLEYCTRSAGVATTDYRYNWKATTGTNERQIQVQYNWTATTVQVQKSWWSTTVTALFFGRLLSFCNKKTQHICGSSYSWSEGYQVALFFHVFLGLLWRLNTVS